MDSLSRVNLYPIDQTKVHKGTNRARSQQMNYFNGIKIPEKTSQQLEPAVFVGGHKCQFSFNL